MTDTIKVHNRIIIIPNSPNSAEIFIGKWVKAQDKAVEKAIWLTNNDIKGYIFDNIVDQLTVKYYVEDNQ